MFDFNDYTAERSTVKDLFKISNSEGKLVDLAEEERAGLLVSAIYDFRAYLLE